MAVPGGEGFSPWACREMVALCALFFLLWLWEGSQIMGILAVLHAQSPLGPAGSFVG